MDGIMDEKQNVIEEKDDCLTKYKGIVISFYLKSVFYRKFLRGHSSLSTSKNCYKQDK